MQTELGQALSLVQTSAQWATLPSIVVKVNQKLDGQSKIDERSLTKFLASIPNDELVRYGIWWTSPGGRNYMPIIITNRAYANSYKMATDAENKPCSCGQGSSVVKKDHSRAQQRYFGCADYNAGRHAHTQSPHHANCLQWTPPSSGHLHSWRRAFDGTQK
jgi:hypothetical protein